MPTWQARVYGDPRGDAAGADESSSKLKRGKSELIESAHWNEVKDLVIAERQRRGLDTSQVITYIAPGNITAGVLNNLLANANVNGIYDDFVGAGDAIKNESVGINDVVTRIIAAGEACVCDCNYCSCDCNQCTCNCDYACTCNCAY